MPRFGPFNETNLNRLIKALATEEALKTQACTQMRQDLPNLLENSFDLTPEQRIAMQHLPEELTGAMGQVLAALLEVDSDVQIRLVPRGRARDSSVTASIEAKCESGGGCSVSGKVEVSIC
jgi:hypothetical protein